MLRRTALAVVAFVVANVLADMALAQSCPTPLADARRLVLVTAGSMQTSDARVQLFERISPHGAWKAVGTAGRARIGRSGMGWSRPFRHLGRGEPVKIEGDKRAPAGIYRLSRSFGFGASSLRDYLRIEDDTVCVDDPVSPAYNTVVSRAAIGNKVRGENMRRVPEYRRGILVDYPTDAAARAGSCIFIHVWKTPARGTAGCVALPEEGVTAVQEFAEPGAVLAILPRSALIGLAGCLPQVGN
jgi:L,D-peptidoglycan transpeptidase YkuD (ErfK/YbiS/YcfS/YnhG family)